MDPTFQLSLDALDSIMLDEINNDSCYDELLTSLIISRLNQSTSNIKNESINILENRGKSTIWEICSKFGIAEGTVLLFTSRIIVALKSLKSQTIIWPRDNYRQEVFRNSKLYLCKNQLFEENDYLLGDSAYPISNMIITPFKNPLENRQNRFNKKHSQTRIVVEQAFGRLKNRFQLLKELRTKNTKMATDLIEISLIMHNLVERLNDVWETSEDTDMHQIQYSIDFNSEISQEIKELGKIKRQNLMDIVL
ncbi:8496_t:CDS:2 [Funneliformis geosporum]|nr:8496_t:CDS:2 [Funneliformis geosporum]